MSNETGVKHLFNFMPDEGELHEQEMFLCRKGNISDPTVFQDMQFIRFQNYIRQVQEQEQEELQAKLEAFGF